MQLTKTQRLHIRTPEGVVFSLLLAGPITRFLAWSIDFACIVVFSQALGGVSRLLGVISPDLAQAVSIAAYFVFSMGYSILLEWRWRGQTIGKRLLRLRVVDAQGLRLTPQQIIIRNLMRVVDLLPLLYLVGGLACLLSRTAQRLGDMAASTVVIRIPRIETPDFAQLLEDKYNSLRHYPHLAARLRQRTSPQDAALALQTLLRRDTLTPQARLEVFAALATYFRTLVVFPPEATDGVSDEQYIRNVVDIVFRAAPVTAASAPSATVA